MARFSKEERKKHEVYRELKDLINDLNYSVDAVVVEGSHDKKTLRLLGCKKPILQCSKLPHTTVTDRVAEKFSDVVILTDFDEQGILLNKKLTSLLETKGVKVDLFYRRRFRKLLKEVKISTIESIYSIKINLFRCCSISLNLIQENFFPLPINV